MTDKQYREWLELRDSIESLRKELGIEETSFRKRVVLWLKTFGVPTIIYLVLIYSLLTKL